MKKFLLEFRKFAMRGNVIDLAVGVIIGGAFQAIVTSLVNDLISPLIGLIAKTDFNQLAFSVGGVNIKYGSFITAVLNFLIMAFVLFLLVKTMNTLSNLGKHNEPKPEVPTVKICPFCCSEIAVKATRCPHCTSILEDVAELSPAGKV